MRHLFNSKISFQKLTIVKNDYGSDTKTWADIDDLTNIPCRINWFTGIRRREFINNGKVEWERDGAVYCGYSTGITMVNRGVYKNKNYDIVNIANFDELDKYMTLNIKRSS